MTKTQPTYRFCRYDTDGPVLTLTIDRPEVHNAINPECHAEMSDAFDRYAADPALRVAIVTGAGERAFCAGNDLKAIAKDGPQPFPRGGFGGITQRADLWKPVIARVNGMAFGGGVEIIAACDIAIAVDDARFGLPEPRVGLVALGGGVLQRFARQLAMKDAMMIALTGDAMSAQDAERMRIVNRIVPRAQLDAEVKRVVEGILKCAPLAVQATKQVMMQSLSEPDLFATIHENYEAVVTAVNSNDAKEGPKAFAEKRAPVWTGT